MLRGLVVGIGGAAIVVGSLTGCASKGPKRIGPPHLAVPVPAANAAVTIDRRPQAIQGPVSCAEHVGDFTIAVGKSVTAIAVTLTPDASTVTSVGLGEVYGVLMGYHEGAPGAKAAATKVGRTYTITGTATGVHAANVREPITKAFEIRVTCP